MKTLTTIAAIGALWGAAATGASAAPDADAAAEKPDRQCFWTRSVNGFTAVDNRTVNVRVGARDIYQLELFAPCPDVNWAETIGIQSRGSSMICSGFDVTVIAPSPIGPQRCSVKTVRKLTPEEVANMPPKQVP